MKKAHNQYITAKTVEYQLANLSQLTFEVTDACNLKCKYCGYGEFYGNYEARENKKLPVDKAIRIIDYLNNLWNSNANVSSSRNVYISFYGGEPLLNMDFITSVVKHVEQLENTRRKFTFSMTTNALLLGKYMDFLVEKNFNLLISLDGNAGNTAYRIDHNNQPAFDRIVENVEKLRTKYPDFFEKKVNFNAVLHNKNSIEDIYLFFKQYYNKQPSIGEVNDNGIRPEKQEEFNKIYRNASESLYQSEHYKEIEKDLFINTATYQTACTFIHQYSGFVFRDYTDLLFNKQNRQTKPTGTCLPFAKKMFITVNGKILPCERIGHNYAHGEITDSEIVLDLQEIAEKYNARLNKITNQCSKCYNTKSCSQCIYYLQNLDSKPICEGFMTKSDFENYYKSQMSFFSQNPEDYYRIMEEIIVE